MQERCGEKSVWLNFRDERCKDEPLGPARPSQGHLQHKTQHAQADHRQGDDGPTTRDFGSECGPRGAGCFMSGSHAVNALHSNGGRALAVNAGRASTALATYVRDPVWVAGANRSRRGLLRWMIGHVHQLKEFSATIVDRVGSVLDRDRVDFDVFNGTVAWANARGANFVDNLAGSVVSDLAKDCVLPGEPGCFGN